MATTGFCVVPDALIDPSIRPSRLASAGGSSFCSLTIQMFFAWSSTLSGRLPVNTVGTSALPWND